jgi:tryptophan 7-halogenase
MGFETDLSVGRSDFPGADEAERLFARIRSFGERAMQDLPSHRALIDQITADAPGGRAARQTERA